MLSEPKLGRAVEIFVLVIFKLLLLALGSWLLMLHVSFVQPIGYGVSFVATVSVWGATTFLAWLQE